MDFEVVDDFALLRGVKLSGTIVAADAREIEHFDALRGRGAWLEVVSDDFVCGGVDGAGEHYRFEVGVWMAVVEGRHCC